MSAAKAKGTRWEVLCRDLLLAQGFHDAHRVLQEGYIGMPDILFSPPAIAVQAKCYRSLADALREGVDGAVRQSGNRHPVAFIKRPGKGAAEEGYAVMRIGDFLNLLKEINGPNPVRATPGIDGSTSLPHPRQEQGRAALDSQPGAQGASDGEPWWGPRGLPAGG